MMMRRSPSATPELRGEWFTFSPEMLTFIPTAPHGRKTRGASPASLVSREEAKALIDELLSRRGVGVPLLDALDRIAIAAEFTTRRARAIYHMEARLIAEHEMKTLRSLATASAGAAGRSVSSGG